MRRRSSWLKVPSGTRHSLTHAAPVAHEAAQRAERRRRQQRARVRRQDLLHGQPVEEVPRRGQRHGVEAGLELLDDDDGAHAGCWRLEVLQDARGQDEDAHLLRRHPRRLVVGAERPSTGVVEDAAEDLRHRSAHTRPPCLHPRGPLLDQSLCGGVSRFDLGLFRRSVALQQAFVAAQDRRDIRRRRRHPVVEGRACAPDVRAASEPDQRVHVPHGLERVLVVAERRTARAADVPVHVDAAHRRSPPRRRARSSASARHRPMRRARGRAPSAQDDPRTREPTRRALPQCGWDPRCRCGRRGWRDGSARARRAGDAGRAATARAPSPRGGSTCRTRSRR